MNNKPIGGTELMYHELMKRLPQSYKDEFSIFNYWNYADHTKRLIFWNQLSYDQSAIQFLNNIENIDKIEQFVFVSHWQAEKFRQIYNIPGYKTAVIKNACIGTEPKTVRNDNKVKICYTSTPWRGLDVLLNSWELLNPQDAELHVFSSCKIYGDDFAESEENKYEHLYDKCNSLPNVIYRGFTSNDTLRQELPSFDILAYPNTFEETSCIAVIEALSAGARVLTSSLGALPETTEGWANIYSYLPNKDIHAIKFAQLLNNEIQNVKTDTMTEFLKIQQHIYYSRWNWDFRFQEWITLLNTLTENNNAK